MEREAHLTRSAEALDAAFRMQQREFAAMLEADCSVLITELEQRIIGRLLPEARAGSESQGFGPPLGPPLVVLPNSACDAP